MRAVIQRVSSASVSVSGKTISSIDRGLLVLVGIEKDDKRGDLDYIARKVSGLRIFPDDDGKMNLSVKESKGSVLLVSQFTLMADASKGRRPGFDRAELPEVASVTMKELEWVLSEDGLAVFTGEFGAHMEVSLVNDGPVTIVLDSRRKI